MCGFVEAKSDEGPKTTPPQYALFFTPERNQVEILSPTFKFDFRDPNKFLLGNTQFSISEFDIQNMPYGYKYLDHYTVRNIIAFKWPQKLLETGTLSIKNLKGKILFKRHLQESDFTKWKEEIEKIRRGQVIDKYSIGTSTYNKKFDFTDYNVGFIGEEDTKIIFKGYIFRYCIESQKGENSVELCSPFLWRRQTGKVSLLKRKVKNSKTQIQINGQNFNSTVGTIPFVDDLNARIRLKNGFEVNVKIKKPEIKVVEVLKNEEKKVVIVGEGPQCLGCELISRDHITEYNSIVSYIDLLNEGKTYNEPKVYWLSRVETEEIEFAYKMIGGADAAIYSFDFLRLPLNEDKPRVLEPRRLATYSSEANIYLRKPGDNYFLESEADGDIQFDSKQETSVWRVRDLKKGVNNKLYLKLTKEEDPYYLSYKIYRGYPYELSGRFTVISSEKADTSLISEVNFSTWWETLLGWENELLSVQRWGMNVKHFRSLIDFKIKETILPIQSTTVDLKYRFTPGLWNWDESFGLTLSYQQIHFGNYSGKMFGPGFIWVRSMPTFFDNLMNLIPIFKYPKWVEAEFLYYPFPANPNTEIIGPNYSLNYRGKILWTNDFYGEAGFGIKKYDFGDVLKNKRVPVFLFYVTGGLGLQF